MFTYSVKMYIFDFTIFVLFSFCNLFYFIVSPFPFFLVDIYDITPLFIWMFLGVLSFLSPNSFISLIQRLFPYHPDPLQDEIFRIHALHPPLIPTCANNLRLLVSYFSLQHITSVSSFIYHFASIFTVTLSFSI